MQELDGVELASFTSPGIAFLIDFVIAGVLFLAVLIAAAKLLNRFTSLGQNNQHVNIELNFFENWYSIVYLVLFFGLSVFGQWPYNRQADYGHSSGFDCPSPHGAVAFHRTGARIRRVGSRIWIRIPAVLHSSEPPDGPRPHGGDHRDPRRARQVIYLPPNSVSTSLALRDA
jgi:hypothetical protein